MSRRTHSNLSDFKFSPYNLHRHHSLSQYSAENHLPMPLDSLLKIQIFFMANLFISNNSHKKIYTVQDWLKPLDSLLKIQIFFMVNLFISNISHKKILSNKRNYAIGLTPVSLEFLRKSLIYYHCNHFLFIYFWTKRPKSETC